MAEKTLTKEEWERIERALSGIYGRVLIKADDFDVTFRRGQVSKNRLGIVCDVNGQIRGEWYDPKKEFPEQRCLRLVSHFVHKPKNRALLKKMSKRERKLLGEFFDPDKKIYHYDVIWPSVTAIRRHYQKTFASIELLEVVGD